MDLTLRRAPRDFPPKLKSLYAETQRLKMFVDDTGVAPHTAGSRRWRETRFLLKTKMPSC